MKRVRVDTPSAYAETLRHAFAEAAREAVARAESMGVPVAGLERAPVRPKAPRAKVAAPVGETAAASFAAEKPVRAPAAKPRGTWRVRAGAKK
jgi:hypothetical protein